MPYDDEIIPTWGKPKADRDDLDDRIFTDLEIIEGVLELARVADYADRRHGDEIEVQLVDAAIQKACFGAARLAHDVRLCVEELMKPAATKGGKQ